MKDKSLFQKPCPIPPMIMLPTPRNISLPSRIEIAGSHVFTRLLSDYDKIDAIIRHKRQSQNAVFVSGSCVCCLPQTCFQTGLSRPCSVTGVTGKGSPVGRRLGPQPLPVGAERPACHCQLAFSLPTLRVVHSSARQAGLGAAPSRFARGQPVSRTAPCVTSWRPTWACGLGAGRPDHAQASPSLETGCPRAKRLGRGLHPHQPSTSARFARSMPGGLRVGALPGWRLPRPHSWRVGASSFGGAARHSPAASLCLCPALDFSVACARKNWRGSHNIKPQCYGER
jgi:hypothetical protein